MYPLNLTYNEQTRRLALDDVAASTGDIGTDEIVLRTIPTIMRGEVLNMVFKLRVPVGKGKVAPPVVPLRFDVATRRWRAVMPKEVLQAIEHDTVTMQLRVGEGKHYYSLNAVNLTASKAIVTK